MSSAVTPDPTPTSTPEASATDPQTDPKVTTLTDSIDTILPFLDEAGKDFVRRNGHKTVGSLVRNLAALEQFTGADKNTLLPLPKEGSIEDADTLQKIYRAIGVPENGQYGDYTREDGKFSLPEGEIKAFDELCAKTGVTPQSRTAMLDLFYKMNDDAQAQMQSQHQEAIAAQQAEWGQAYAPRRQAAQQALQNLEGGKDLFAMFERQGMADNPALLRFGHALAQLTAEDGNHGSQTGGMATLTPEQAREAYTKFERENFDVLTGKAGTPYDKKAALAERDRLARLMVPPTTV